ERRTQLGAWREQRSQLTQALHMWATRAGGAKQRVAQTKEKLDQENARLPQAEQAFRTAQERLTEARSQLMQAQSRLQLEQANRTHLERAAEALGQRRERLEAERQALGAPDAGALAELEARIAQIDGSLQAARQAVEAVLRERLHALQSGSIDAGFSERPPAKASLFEASRELSTAPAADLPLAAKVHALDEGIRGALADWLSGVFVCEGRPSASIRG